MGIKGNFTSLTSEEYLKIYSTKDEKQFDFRNIQRINKYLGFEGGDNLWYIFHPVAKSSFGPCSSENLQEMYNGGMLDGQSELRFIDVYSLKNTESFSFFKLKDMESPNFLKKIEPSAVLKKAIKVPVAFPNDNNSKINSRKESSSIYEGYEQKNSKPIENTQIVSNLENENKSISNNKNIVSENQKNKKEVINKEPIYEDKNNNKNIINNNTNNKKGNIKKNLKNIFSAKEWKYSRSWK